MSDQSLLTCLDDLTRRHAAGISEFQLINLLDKDPEAPFSRPDMLDNWALFKAHFWLFHHLYLLQMSLREEGERLDILATCIQRYRTSSDRPSKSDTLTTTDPMADYYLDLDNLDRETPEGLNDKLNAFWQRLGAPQGQSSEDWQTLELSPPQSAPALRTQYRRLCQQHHPDRGGDAQRFKAIQGAYARLKHQARRS